MRLSRRTILFVLPLIVLLATPGSALAQAVPEEKGVCAPWHRCLAMGSLGLAILAVLALGVGFMIQRRGFERIEHRQGNPEGVEVDEHR